MRQNLTVNMEGRFGRIPQFLQLVIFLLRMAAYLEFLPTDVVKEL